MTTHIRQTRCLLLLATTAMGCAAVFPELSTPVHDAPPSYRLEPPPPADLLFVAFARAHIPAKTRDGRSWDAVGGSLPDPFAKLIVDNNVILTTPVESNTLEPTWPKQRRGNYRIRANASVRVEVWDNNPLGDHPICAEEIHDIQEESSAERHLEIDCASGALVELIVEPAHAKIGLGLFYEMRTEDVFITRVVQESPAARAGVEKGDQVVRLMGRSAHGMDEGAVRSAMHSNGPTGLALELRGRHGETRSVTIKDGPIYPLIDEALE